ncbi:hypothetical protein [Thiolinea disciformis]|uniref:hypothetical protein n=1 Tax=Thiolinea disciformis TaxID=125614 RepID=UPI00037EFC5A|nr:hypothetical protein [Thiolinea disciformis]
MKKITHLMLGAIVACVFMQTAFACSPPIPPSPGQENQQPTKIIASANGLYMVKLVPPVYTRDPQRGLVISRNAYGEAFRAKPDGSLELMWKMPLDYVYYRNFEGEYFLDDDGIFLVQINFAKSLDDKKAMRVYQRGKLIFSYSPRTFMPQLNRFQVSTCGNAPWIKRESAITRSPIVLKEHYLAFQTIDAKKWWFDIRKPPAQAKGSTQSW